MSYCRHRGFDACNRRKCGLFCVLLWFVSFGSRLMPSFFNSTWKSKRVTGDEDLLTAMIVTGIVMFATKRF
ncbi:unnamed protein product [Caenorhabditis nigoni]